MIPNNEFIESLIRFQKEVGPILKNKINTFHKSKYADLDSVLDSTREALHNNGLFIIQNITTEYHNERLFTFLRTVLIHKSGIEIESRLPLPSLEDPQKIGSAITYYRRYSYMTILGLSSEDDDGNSYNKINSHVSTESNNVNLSPITVSDPEAFMSEAESRLTSAKDLKSLRDVCEIIKRNPIFVKNNSVSTYLKAVKESVETTISGHING